MTKLTIPAVALLALVIAAFNSAFIIDQAEQGILVQFR